MKSLYMLAMMAALLPCGNANALTVTFAGTVTSSDTPFVNPADTFTGSYTYDPSTPDTDSDPDAGNYLFAPSMLDIIVVVDGITFETNPLAYASGFISSNDLFAPQHSAFLLTATIDAVANPSSPGLIGQDIDLSFLSYLFQNDALPTSVPISDANVPTDYQVKVALAGQSNGIIGQITTLNGSPVPTGGRQTEVPEPATMTLLGVSLFGGLATRRKKAI